MFNQSVSYICRVPKQITRRYAIRRMKPIANGIHSGLRTHNHDQAITLSSFKTINAIANNPQNPTPPDFVVDDTLLILVIKLKVRALSGIRILVSLIKGQLLYQLS